MWKIHPTKYHDTVKPLNFARDLISLILQVMKIREIKYPRMFKFYIDSNSKASRFVKLSTCKDGSNLQFAKLSPREIKVFYSNNNRDLFLALQVHAHCRMDICVFIVSVIMSMWYLYVSEWKCPQRYSISMLYVASLVSKQKWCGNFYFHLLGPIYRTLSNNFSFVTNSV